MTAGNKLRAAWTPELRAAQGARTKAHWTPERRASQSAKMRAAWARVDAPDKDEAASLTPATSKELSDDDTQIPQTD